MKRLLWRGAIACGVAAAIGLGSVLSGVIPLGATSGHWPVTLWMLQFTKRRTIAARALPLDAPPLDDRPAIARGAGHFESACRPCHGAPGTPVPVVLRNMLPRPPPLSERVPTWRAEELFWIVKNGIKLTGMPGWPTGQRDDEVWDMVAFLEVLPELDAGSYRLLAQGDGEREAGDGASGLAALDGPPPPVALAGCARCHGYDGLGRDGGAFPVLAGQKAPYLETALDAYARGGRPSGVMQPVAAALDRAARRALAEYYARRGGGFGLASAGRQRLDDAAIERGRAIATEGVPARRIPACAECHGPTPTERNVHYPFLAGQHPAYIVRQLELFHDGRRGGTRYAHVMVEVAGGLTAEDRRDAAAYYASLVEAP